MKTINIVCFGFGQVAKNFIKKINSENLKIDLSNELVNNENFRLIRYEKARTCSFLLNTKLPKTIENVKEYTNKYEQVFHMYLFVPNNNTFKELLTTCTRMTVLASNMI